MINVTEMSHLLVPTVHTVVLKGAENVLCGASVFYTVAYHPGYAY